MDHAIHKLIMTVEKLFQSPSANVMHTVLTLNISEETSPDHGNVFGRDKQAVL